jgi:hypothetical protein
MNTTDVIMDGDILSSNNQPWALERVVKSVFTRKGFVASTHEVMKYDGGGFLIRPKEKPELPTPQEKVPEKTFKVRVHHADMDPENTGVTISVNCIRGGKSKPKRFLPGTVQELTEAELNVFKYAVRENKLEVPIESGIYQTANPLLEAQRQYPSMDPIMENGIVYITKRQPRFIVEHV